MDRRTFIASAAGLAGCAALPRHLLAAPPPEAAPRFRISLAQWSLHRTLRAGRLDNLDFARTARKDYGIEGVEYVNSFFKDKARDSTYLASMKKRAADAGVRSLLIMCDGEGHLGDPDATRRKNAVERHKKWLEAARFLGCHSIRVNAHSQGSPDEQRKLVAEGLASLASFASRLGLNVIVENHGGLSSNGGWLASVMKTVSMQNCGTLPDFGNFRVSAKEEYDRYKGVRELMPWAKAVSAKSHDFDAKGNERHTDYRRMLDIVLAAGYRGWVGIEYEGSSLSEQEGIRATLRLLKAVRTELGKKR